MEKTKILIVDDEVLIAEDLKDILKSFGFKKTELCHDKESAIRMLHSFLPDVVLLDIRMERELDGLEIGEYIKSNFNTPFIFITAHSDVAMIKEIVKTKPAGYITKPFKKSDLFANINLALEQLRNKQSAKKQLQLKDGYKTLLVDFDEINYIESEGNYLNIFCDSRKLLSRQSLDSILEELDRDMFFKIHRSYIVNLKKITMYSKKEVNIKDLAIPISRNCVQEFEKKMNSSK